MKSLKTLQVCALVFGSALLNSQSLFAAAVASDNASNSAYNSGWSNSSNGGSGFGAWQLGDTYSNPSNGGFFIGSSQGNGSNDGNIDTSGSKSWGLYANSGDVTNAVRTFTSGGSNGQSILGSGEKFSLSLDNGYIDSGGTVGFGLQNSSGANRIEFYYANGSSSYSINIGGTTLATGIGFTSAGLSILFTQNSGTGWSMAITPNGGSTSTFTDASAGSAALAASDISQVRVFNANAGGGGARDAFANSMQVVPEPSSIALLLCGFAGGALALRRKRA